MAVGIFQFVMPIEYREGLFLLVFVNQPDLTENKFSQDLEFQTYFLFLFFFENIVFKMGFFSM
jgi:hypothetical protein